MPPFQNTREHVHGHLHIRLPDHTARLSVTTSNMNLILFLTRTQLLTHNSRKRGVALMRDGREKDLTEVRSLRTLGRLGGVVARGSRGRGARRPRRETGWGRDDRGPRPLSPPKGRAEPVLWSWRDVVGGYVEVPGVGTTRGCPPWSSGSENRGSEDIHWGVGSK